MALFGKGGIPIAEVRQLKTQGYSDNQIIDELKGKGYPLPQINDALAQAGLAGPETIDLSPLPSQSMPSREEMPSSAYLGEELQGRIEEIAESIIDEKWDILIEEVKKVVEWKNKVEETITKLHNDVDNLREDFRELHQGVLGKLEDYDSRMTEVGTELKAVGKVFKDVIPEFVENVKELKGITQSAKKR